MDDRLADILDQCVERLTQGASVEDCLVAFPGDRAELELPLQLARQLRALPHPPLPTAARVALEQNLLDIAKRRRMNPAPTQTPPAPAQPNPWRALAPAAILAGILRAAGYRGSLAQPWLRLAALAITIVLALTLSAGAFAAARALINIARPQPTATPTSAPTATPIALDGRIEQLAQERWVVGGRAVILSATTAVSGTPALNATAHVHGNFAADGALLALRITVDPIVATPSATPTATRPPTSTLALSPTTVPTAIPTAPPTAIPAAAPAPAPPPASPPGGDPQHTCQGQQRGRDVKKCDPKPKNNNGKNDNGKPDKNKKGK